ncbi:hypothetical protein CR513_40258, partial [Mucuna pruriens]
MTRSSTDPLTVFDPEIELTLRRLRKIRNTVVNSSADIESVANSNQLCTDNLVSSSNVFAESGQMENNDRTLKELATPDVVYQPWCIQYPQLEPAQTYELKSGLIHLLPKFHGLAGEDPHKHLKEFHVVCSTMRPQGISEKNTDTLSLPHTHFPFPCLSSLPSSLFHGCRDVNVLGKTRVPLGDSHTWGCDTRQISLDEPSSKREIQKRQKGQIPLDKLSPKGRCRKIKKDKILWTIPHLKEDAENKKRKNPLDESSSKGKMQKN